MFLEWVKLDISNLLHRLIVVTSSIHMIPRNVVCSWSHDLFKFWEISDKLPVIFAGVSKLKDILKITGGHVHCRSNIDAR